METSLQKSSMFSTVRSCSRKTFIATSVPFQIPLNTSPKNPKQKSRKSKKNISSLNIHIKNSKKNALPMPTRVPTVSSEKSMSHSSNGIRGLFIKEEVWSTLFQVAISCRFERNSGGPLIPELLALNWWGEDGRDTAL